MVTAAIQERTAVAPGEAQMLEMVKRVGLNYNDSVKLYGQKKIDDEFYTPRIWRTATACCGWLACTAEGEMRWM